MIRKNRALSHVRSFQVEPLENRLLMAVNSWKSAVSGNWTDPTKWSLGHVPTQAEDVEIKQAGNYTVTIPSNTTGTYYSVNKFTMNGTGTQVLSVNAVLYSYSTLTVGAGDSVNIYSGRFLNYGPTGTSHLIDGTITLNGIYGKASYLSVGGATVNGAGSIVFATGGVDSTYSNYLNGNTWAIGSNFTIRGKGGNITGTFTNNGTIKAEGGTSDYFYWGQLKNNGSFTAGATNNQIYHLTNNAGKTLSFTGGTVDFRGNYVNNGTINLTNVTKTTYGQVMNKPGVVNRVNSPVLFKGILDAQNQTFAFDNSTGQWIWAGGRLKNMKYDPTAPLSLKIDPAQGNWGEMENVTLTNNLSVPAGFYISNYGTITLGGNFSKIILNGSTTQGSAFYTYGGQLTGNGEVIFNTVGINSLNGNGWTLGPGVLVHGKKGAIGGGFTNQGTILADTAGTVITINDVINNGSIIAAPGKIVLYRYSGNQANSALTVGIGGTAAGTSYGQIAFSEPTYAYTIGGAFNVVTLNGYTPTAGTSFTAVTFVKPPGGAFATFNLDAGNGKGFDSTLSATSLVVKAKTVAGPFASRDSLGNLKVTGTSGIDTIIDKLQGYIHYATLNGKTSVFFSPQITSVTLDGGDGNDTITNNSGQGAKVLGGKGDDKLIGGSNNDTLDGGDGNDSLTGNTGNDLLIGGNGNDTLVGSAGDDTYQFAASLALETDLIAELSGGGLDTLDFSLLASTVAVKVNLASDTLATHTNRTVKTQTLGQWANFENAKGGAGADSLTGNAAANNLRGGSGNDTIDGAAGNDSIFGDAGDDRLTGGTGNDSIQGNDGIDTFFTLDSLVDSLDGGLGVDIVSSSDATDVKTNI